MVASVSSAEMVLTLKCSPQGAGIFAMKIGKQIAHFAWLRPVGS